MKNFRKEDLLTASEIARYVYCQRAWAYDHQKIRLQRRSRRWWIILLSLSSVLGIASLVIGRL